MSAQIINLHAWRVAHSERPVRVWLAWWGVR
jgi:hypothetical protein